MAQVAFQLQQVQRLHGAGLVEDLEALPAVRLGAVHGDVGVAQQLLGACGSGARRW